MSSGIKNIAIKAASSKIREVKAIPKKSFIKRPEK